MALTDRKTNTHRKIDEENVCPNSVYKQVFAKKKCLKKLSVKKSLTKQFATIV